MSFDLQLNAGAGGAKLRVLPDGVRNWPSSVMAWASVVDAEASVCHEVTPATPLPVGVVGTIDVNDVATVDHITTVGEITDPVTVVQADYAALQMTSYQGGTWDISEVHSIATPVAVSGIATPVAVSAITNPVTVSAITNPVPLAAGANLIGQVSAYPEASGIYYGGVFYPILFARFQSASAGNTQVVAAQGAGMRILVVRYSLSAKGEVDATFRSGASTELSGTKYLTTYAAAGGAFTPGGIFKTAANEALNINLSAAVNTSGELSYIVVPN